MKDDFKNVLQATIQASWDIVRTAMSFFSYFDGLDEVRIFLNDGLMSAFVFVIFLKTIKLILMISSSFNLLREDFKYY